MMPQLPSRFRSRLAGSLAVVTTVLGIMLLATPERSDAQLSCDDPPIDVSRLVTVWDKTDFCQFEEGVFDDIISGGVPRDGIPPIDNPEFQSIDAASEWLQPQSPLIAVEVDGVARGYPLAILTRHEIVNDVIGEMPVIVTFCPLCNSALVFDSRVEGEPLRFGVSGLLRNSDLIMWDDRTQSWWQQFTGTGIVGEFTGYQLDLIPSQVVGFEAFADAFPNGQVLSRGRGSYGTNPYTNYDSSAQPFLFRGEPDSRLFATERVLAGLVDGQPIAYPFPTLEAERVINDTVGERDVVAIWQPGAASALGASQIDQAEDVGMAALYSRRLDNRVLTFESANGVIRDLETGSTWNVFGRAVEGELSGTQLEPEFAAPHFWFAWAAFRPETEVYGLE